jgi:hypothetical protein
MLLRMSRLQRRSAGRPSPAWLGPLQVKYNTNGSMQWVVSHSPRLKGAGRHAAAAPLGQPGPEVPAGHLQAGDVLKPP